MDQRNPSRNEALSSNANDFYPDSQHYNAFDTLFPNGSDQNFNDASWGVNASTFPQQTLSRAAVQTQSWPHQHHNNTHLSAQSPSNDGHVRPPIFARSPHHSPAPFAQQTNYNAFGGQPPYNFQQPQYDPSLLANTPQPQSHPQLQPHPQAAFKEPYVAYNSQPAGPTVAPQSLEPSLRQKTPVLSPNYAAPSSQRPAIVNTSNSLSLVDQDALARAIPIGEEADHFSIINFDKLVRATNSERMGNYVTIGRNAQEWSINRAAVPAFVPRKSKNELKRLAGKDATVLAKINQKSSKKARTYASTLTKPNKLASALPPNASQLAIKYEKVDDSGDDSSDSDDDSSEYTSDSDVEDSPLPSKRPDTARGAVEYDTVKALWRSKRKVMDATNIRNGLVDFWEIVKTIRDRWKTDSAAVLEAEKKGLKGELPLLRQRVKDQRDMIEYAFKAALKHGSRSIIGSLSENMSFLFLCYQFLLDRTKDDDFNGSLSRCMLELMSLFATVTDEKLTKVHLNKVLPRFVKGGDAKTQYFAKAVIAKGGATKVEKASDVKSDAAKTVKQEDGKALVPTKTTEPTTGTKRPASNIGTGTAIKKVAVGSTKPGIVSKGVTKPEPLGSAKASVVSGGIVRPASASASSASAKSKPATTKLTSGLFAGLQSAAKKPGTSTKSASGVTSVKEMDKKPAAAAPVASTTFSFAETMRNLAKPKEEKPAPKPEKELPPETAEQKAKRLRREARGQLRVRFRDAENLVEVRVFTHDPDEESGHDSSQTRDVADLRGEGRMFKQQHNSVMDLDDEEEDTLASSNTLMSDAAAEGQLVEWNTPKDVDFSVVDSEARVRNYFPHGGGMNQPESAEREVREKYEANTLMVFYGRPEDIPPNPRETEDANIVVPTSTITSFGEPQQKYIERARHQGGPQTSTAPIHPAPINFDLLRSALSKQTPNGTPPSGQAFAPQATAPPANGGPLDLNAILAQLNQGSRANQQNTSQAPNFTPQQHTAYGTANQVWPSLQPQYQQPPPSQQHQPPQTVSQPNGTPDIQAILANLKNVTANINTTTPAPVHNAFNSIPTASANTANTAPDFSAFMQQLGQQAQQRQSDGENAERKRWREQGDAGGGNGAATDSEHPFYKTKVCKYWQQGKCMKGDGCTYRHT